VFQHELSKVWYPDGQRIGSHLLGRWEVALVKVAVGVWVDEGVRDPVKGRNKRV